MRVYPNGVWTVPGMNHKLQQIPIRRSSSEMPQIRPSEPDHQNQTIRTPHMLSLGHHMLRLISKNRLIDSFSLFQRALLRLVPLMGRLTNISAPDLGVRRN